MLIDVYDFDGTIYDGDSTVDLVFFCLRRHPVLAKHTPHMLAQLLRLALGKIGLTDFKTDLLGKISRVCSLEEEARLFWQQEKTLKKLGAWFQKTPRDLPIVIASASPEFELQYAMPALGMDTLIGTRCDIHTGKLIGKNCKGEEKLRRIHELLGDYEIRAMYTDSIKSDGPLLRCAQEGYILKHGKISPFAG